MKKFFGLSVAVIFLTVGVLAAAGKHFWHGDLMGVDATCKRWGEAKFNLDKFKGGEENVRASMTCSLIRNKQAYLHKDRTDIREAFGNPDGFYFSDIFPAYMIERAKNEKGNSWQIVFLLDKNEKVDDIVVHKNCCDN